MKTSAAGIRCARTNQLRHLICFAALFAFALGLPLLAWSQAPGLLWSTNLGAQVFAVDEQTNVYAQAGKTVIKLNGAGVPLQTNTMSGDNGLAQRDSAGNLYYAAARPGTVGQVYVTHTNPPYYLLKFDAAGTLMWSNFFGFTGDRQRGQHQ